MSIIIVESGGFEPDAATQQLSDGDVIGHPYFRLDGCRERGIGGATARWGGWCRPLDAVDFKRQTWVPWSGWPITFESLQPFYREAAKVAQLPMDGFDFQEWRERMPEALPLDDSEFENGIVQFSKTNFRHIFQSELQSQEMIWTFIYANVTELTLRPGSNAIELAKVATLTGRTFDIYPRIVVLAAGAIENARLLLSSRADRKNGLGNETDCVGRFFMEHLHVAAGHIIARSPANGLGFYSRADYSKTGARGLLIPRARALENGALLTTSITIGPASYAHWPVQLRMPHRSLYLPMRFNKIISAGPFGQAAKAIRRGLIATASLPQRFSTWNAARIARSVVDVSERMTETYSLYFRAAQAPNPDSRITLDARRDALGMLRAQLDWRVAASDLESVSAWIRALDRVIGSRASGRVAFPQEGWESGVTGGPHHMGTTRMATAAKAGVVDEHCRVHSVANLFVAGSSVFATAGHANPTLTILALSLRLAAHLEKKLR